LSETKTLIWAPGVDIICMSGYSCSMRRAHERRNPKDVGLAVILRRARVKRGETQEDVARRAGLTVAAYARIERGISDPKWTTVRAIAEALEISLARFDSRPRSGEL
jgi:DNA-binding XRE family transcriptional regulator